MIKKLIFLISFFFIVFEVTYSSEVISGGSVINKTNSHKPENYFAFGAEHLNLTQMYFDLPVIYNKQVEMWVNYFTGRGRDLFIRYAQRAGKYARLMGDIIEKRGESLNRVMPRDLIFLAMAESGFHSRAKSSALAKGPWQFMPYTGRLWNLKRDFYIDERYDYIKSTIAAVDLLDDLYKTFGSWELAMSAYNAGPGKISRAIKMYNTRNFWELISKGRYLKSETKNYVPKIFALAIIGKNLKKFGFNELSFDEPVNFDVVEVSGGSDLFSIATALDISYEDIHELNPEILRWMIPPHVEKYDLRLPEGIKKRWDECCRNRSFMANSYQTYTSTSETHLTNVARRFRLKTSILAEVNGVSEKSIVKKGQEVRLPFRIGQTFDDPMYRDFYELPRKSIRQRRDYRSRIQIASQAGEKITNPQEFYVVKKGETLWDISKKKGVSLNTLIRSNYQILNSRMIREGDRLIIR